jgi:ABC-type glycerol-3-phosphate transport system substrate-binding protein
MEGDQTFDPADFWDGSLEACQDKEGRSLGVPTTIQVWGIFYDDEAFTEAGIPAPHPGWTWDDFRAAIAAVGKAGVRYGYAEQSYNTILIPKIDGEIALSGGEIETEKMQKTVQWYLDLANEGVIFPPLYAEDADSWNKLWQKWQEMFTSPQRPAMWVGQISESFPGAEWVNDESNPFANLAVNVDGFAPFPVSTDNPDEKTSIAITQCLSVSRGSLNPHAAWTWINFLTQQWTARTSNQMWDLMQIPSRKSTIEANDYWKILPEKAVPALQFALEHAWYQPGSYGLETSVVINTMAKAAAGFGEFSTILAQAKEDMPVYATPIPDNEPVVVATVQPPLPPDADVVNYFANVSGRELDTLTKLTERYNQDHPDQFIKLTTQLDVQGDWFPTLVDQFDCFNWYMLDPTSQDANKVLPLDTLLEKEGTDFINDYNPELFKKFTYDDRLYGLPVSSDFQMMAYNKDLLAKKGLTAPKNDWTFEDFARMLEVIGGGEGSERTYGYKLDMWDESLFYGKDVKWADLQADPPVPMLNSQDMTSFVEWIVQLKNSGGIFLQTQENYMEADEAFRSGRIAFFQTNASQPEGWYFINEEPPFEIGLAPFPLFNDFTGGFFIGYERAHMISRESQKAQACWDWFKYLSEQPGIQLGVPARHSVMESSAWETVVGKEKAEAMRAGMENLRPQLEITEFSPIIYPLGTWRSEAIRKALNGEAVVSVLNEAQHKSEGYLDCMKGVEFDQTNQETIQVFVEKMRACALQVDPDGEMWKQGN